MTGEAFDVSGEVPDRAVKRDAIDVNAHVMRAAAADIYGKEACGGMYVIRTAPVFGDDGATWSLARTGCFTGAAPSLCVARRADDLIEDWRFVREPERLSAVVK